MKAPGKLTLTVVDNRAGPIAIYGRYTSMSPEEHLCNAANETTAACFLEGLGDSLHYLSGLDGQGAVPSGQVERER